MMYSHLPPLLEHFSEIVYPGLDAFLIEDVEAFFTDESQFSFALKKVRGQGVLYGFDHVDLRARMVNDLPKVDRLRIMLAKFKHAGIFSDFELSQIQDVLDIGMGHSVYVIQFPDKKWVLKARDPKHQLFYCDLLGSLGWPSFKAKSIQTENGFWELSEYLKGDVLGSLFHPGACLSGSIEKELASHAALGDVMGRGDRHFENYVVSEGHIYPVDLSHLFWVDNEIWVNRYISGGMAEFSSLGFFSNDPVVFCSKIESFFAQYVETLTMLKAKQSTLNDTVSRYFPPEIARSHISFISKRLENIEAYFLSQKESYGIALNEYLRRRRYKLKLAIWGKKRPDILERYPRLKMYYFADHGRLSAFFLEDLFGDGEVYSLIKL